jgi:hypothetical protein
MLSNYIHWLKKPTIWRLLIALALTALFLLTLHVIEVVMWALSYLVFPDVPQLASFEQAVYFSFITFTTLGYGDITLQGIWHLANIKWRRSPQWYFARRLEYGFVVCNNSTA